eukprot:g19354.t1
MTTAVRGVGTKRPRAYVATAEEPPLSWAGRVPKPAMDADSFVDYGSGFLRKSCDSCVSSKRRCDGHDPCTRCLRRKKPCHYTERKKCGPRSGQKTTNKMRRLYTAETQLRRRFPGETQTQHQRPNRAHPDHAGSVSGVCRSAPPPQATPTLSAVELSGETTCVDHTDYSDNGLPAHQVLLRDESGSSWWSLDDQGAGARVEGGLPARVNGEGTSWPRHEHSQHRRQGTAKMYGRGDGTGGASGAPYGYNEQGHGGLWSGLHSSSTTTGSGSGGSAGESWEDDESEEGLGQAEEEVAVLLLGLGKANEDFEGFSDENNDENGRGPKSPARHMSTSTASQEWSV